MSIRRSIAATIGAVSLALGTAVAVPAAYADPPPSNPTWDPGAPAAGVNWSRCLASEQFCVDSITVNGASSSIGISILDGASRSFNWASPPGINAGDDIEFVVRVGQFVPRYTFATADGLTITNVTDQWGDTTMTVRGKATEVDWAYGPGQTCQIGNCDNTMDASLKMAAFTGNTQDMAAWNAGERAMFEGTYLATDAQSSGPAVQYFNSPIEPGGDPVKHWEFQLANPHFDMNHVPAEGSFTAYIPPNYFTANGIDPADTDFSVTRDDAGVLSTVDGSTTRDSNGGAKLSIPTLHYSSPTLKVKSIARATPPSSPPTSTPSVTVPGIPTKLSIKSGKGKSKALKTITWSPPTYNGGAAVQGYRETITRTYKAKVKIKGKPRLVSKTQVVLNTTTPKTSATYKAATGSTYRVEISAYNSAGTGRSSGASFR